MRENFPTATQKLTLPRESISVWYIDQKSAEDNEAVTWGVGQPGRCRQRGRRQADDDAVPLVHDRWLSRS